MAVNMRKAVMESIRYQAGVSQAAAYDFMDHFKIVSINDFYDLTDNGKNTHEIMVRFLFSDLAVA